MDWWRVAWYGMVCLHGPHLLHRRRRPGVYVRRRRAPFCRCAVRCVVSDCCLHAFLIFPFLHWPPCLSFLSFPSFPSFHAGPCSSLSPSYFGLFTRSSVQCRLLGISRGRCAVTGFCVSTFVPVLFVKPLPSPREPPCSPSYKMSIALPCAYPHRLPTPLSLPPASLPVSTAVRLYVRTQPTHPRVSVVRGRAHPLSLYGTRSPHGRSAPPLSKGR